MQTCTNCGGGGLVGSGANPRALEGNKSTCSVCGGTGQVADGGQQQQETPAATDDESATTGAPVDNTDAPTPKSGGILKKIFG